VRKWAILRKRLIEIAKVMRRYPWMAEVIRQRQLRPHPYIVEVYVAVDGSEACLSLNPPKAFCAQNGSVREVRFYQEIQPALWAGICTCRSPSLYVFCGPPSTDSSHTEVEIQEGVPPP
jgi:hypothetical protein